MRSGISSLISYALYVGIGLSVVTIALQAAMPAIESMRDSAAIDSRIDSFQSLGDKIDTLAQQAENSQTTHQIQVNRGEVRVANSSVIYSIETESGAISAGSNRSIGRIVLEGEYLNNETQLKRVTVTLDYSDSDTVRLRGFNGTLGSGFQELTLRNDGQEDGRALITIER
jgi:hypothetical protein